MIYYVYSLPPCDDWDAFVPIKKYLRAAHEPDALEWLDRMRRIVQEAVYWEGNPHTECVSAIPDVDNWPIRIYSAKQPNNGTTFVVSPVPLFHLHCHEQTGTWVEIKLIEWCEPKEVFQ